MSDARVIAALAILAGVLFYSRRANAAVNPSPGIQTVEDWNFVSPVYGGDVNVQSLNDNASKRLRAFLYAIRSAEHDERDVQNEIDYFTFYGRSRFSGTADHPVLTGEMKGVKLPDRFCAAAGFAVGCVSTAAGAYQFNVPTWNEIRSYNGPRLADFSPASQDEAARRLLVKIGAAPAVLAGDWEHAIGLAAPRWASLPGSRAGQGGRDLPFMLARIGDGLTVG